jgi:predicted phosphohydrolase
MTRLAFLTDTHFDCLDPGKTQKFGRWVKSMGDACVITGDIATGDTLPARLTEFQNGFEGEVYFVLGNHDRWKSSFAQVEKDMRILCAYNANLHWLGDGKVYQIGHTQLCGVDGWYDYQCGDITERMRVGMNDWHEIEEFKKVNALATMGGYTKPLIDMLRELGQDSAIQAREVLAKCDKTKPVLFATHVPPFKEASWHEGKISNDQYLPFYTNIALGYVLNEWAKDAQYLTTLCGHCHSAGTYQALPTHHVVTGAAEYGNPRVNTVFNLS